MPALRPTEFTATITWLGRVSDRRRALTSMPVDRLEVTFAGPVGDDHAGLTRPACGRVMSQYARGTPIRNVRQLSIVSQEEVALIARDMGLDSLDPAWLGATMVVAGIPDFTHIPPGSRLQGAGGATVTVDMENRACHLPAGVIAGFHPDLGKGFKSAARNRRGVTAWVEREGAFERDEVLRLHVPDQPVWTHLAAACGRLL